MATKTIHVSEIQDGMQLAEPVKNSFGQMLLNSGVSLESKHKLLFKTWGVERILILCTDEELIEEENKLSLAPEFADSRFKWQPRNEFEKELFELASLFTQNGKQ